MLAVASLDYLDDLLRRYRSWARQGAIVKGSFAALWLALVPGEARAIAEFAHCSGRDLLDDLAKRDAGAHRRILDAAGNAANANAVLWRIEGAAGGPSFIFGTVHVADPRLQELSAPVKEALSTARVVVLERAISSPEAIRSVMPLAARFMMDTTKSLDNVLNEDELAILRQAMGAAGLAPELARALRPWAATLFLASSKCEEERQKAGLVPLDLIVAKAASDRGLTPVGLEGIVEQYEAMSSIPEDVQAAWLKASISLHDRIDDMSETTVKLYLARRIEAVWDLSVELSRDVGMTTEMAARLRHGLVTVRNVRMAERLLPIVSDGGAFVAVGMSHLPGPGGVVELLRAQGWKITPVL